MAYIRKTKASATTSKTRQRKDQDIRYEKSFSINVCGF